MLFATDPAAIFGGHNLRERDLWLFTQVRDLIMMTP